MEYLADKDEIVRLGFEGGRRQYGPPEATAKKKPAPTPQQDYANLLASLKLAKPVPAEIHNLELRTSIDSSLYPELKEMYGAHPDNKQVIVPLNIGGQKISAKISTTGTVEVKSKLSQKPFRLQEEGDVSMQKTLLQPTTNELDLLID